MASSGFKKDKKLPLSVAEMDNFGFFEGSVKSIQPKDNKKNLPQVYLTLENRIYSIDRSRVRYTMGYFVAFQKVAEEILRRVKPGQQLRVRYRLGSFSPPGSGRLVASHEIEKFRIYESQGEEIAPWMDGDSVFDAAFSDGFADLDDDGADAS